MNAIITYVRDGGAFMYPTLAKVKIADPFFYNTHPGDNPDCL